MLDENGNEINNDDSEAEKKPRMDQRIEKALSEKAKAEEDAEKANKTAEKHKLEAETAKKDLEFFRNFNTVSTKYEGAAEFQDQIKEKVSAGYDLEDATVAVLNKQGRFVPPPPTPQPKESPAGGSAITNLSKGSKSVSDMSQEERRAILNDNLNLSP